MNSLCKSHRKWYIASNSKKQRKAATDNHALTPFSTLTDTQLRLFLIIFNNFAQGDVAYDLSFYSQEIQDAYEPMKESLQVEVNRRKQAMVVLRQLEQAERKRG